MHAAKTSVGRERPHLVRLSAAQEYVGSLPHSRLQFARSRLGRVHGSEHKFCNASHATNFNRKGESPMALLKAPSKQPKTTNLQVRLEEEVRRNLDRYAEFLDANPSYVVSEALKFLFRKDDEFKRWAEHIQTQPITIATQFKETL